MDEAYSIFDEGFPARTPWQDERGLPPGARGVRLGDAPTVSVVVASCREVWLLEACLRSLLPQCRAHGAELIVARAGTSSQTDVLARQFPTVQFVRAGLQESIPRLRALGMAEATGDIVALTEDHCIASEDWLPQLVRGHTKDRDVVGGAMDNAQRERAIDWAAFFAEYGFFSPGGNRSAQSLITGANVAYSRRVVEEVIEWARQGEWENVAHDRLREQGSTMHFLRSAAVFQNKNYGFLSFCRDRFEHGRGYARRRLVDNGGRRRWLYLPGSVILPFFLTFRVARAVARDQRLAFLRALPLTFAFLAAWSAGEGWGYALGPATSEEASG